MKLHIRLLLISLLMLPSGVASAHADPLAYVIASFSQFGIVDLATGAFSPIGAPAPEPLAGLVWDRSGSLLSVSASGDLVRIDPATGAMTLVGATGLGSNAFAFAGVRGQLYLTDFANNIYTVDRATGAATFLRATGMPPDPSVPFTFNSDGTLNLCDETLYPMMGRLFATFDSFDVDPASAATRMHVDAKLYEIDPATGAATAVGSTQPFLGATVEVDGRLYGFDTPIVGFAGGFPVVTTTLVQIDVSTGATTFVRNVDPAASVILGAAPVRSSMRTGGR